MRHVVFMAGGKGTRFWPLSREHLPKQFLNIDGNHTLIESGLQRISTLAPIERRWLVGSYSHEELFGSITHLLQKERLILESIGRNTGPCMVLGACEILRQDPDAVLIFLPADHHIGATEILCEQLVSAADHAYKTHDIVIIGIQPTHAFTGYGYIEVGNRDQLPYSVKAFKEKPDQDTAKYYFESGQYYWNSGIYVVHAKSFIDFLEACQPEMVAHIRNYINMSREQQSGVAGITEYSHIKSLSIEHSAIEAHPEKLALFPARFDWNDVGSWGALADIIPPDQDQNIVTSGSFVSVNAHQNIIVSNTKRIIAAIDISDLVIVDTPDALLILPRQSDQRVKEIVDQIPDIYK